jgi:hypothetical protein
MKAKALGSLSAVAWSVATALFVFSCYSAASDAQGAILFLFSGPVTLLLLAVAVVFGLLTRREGKATVGALIWLSGAELVFVILFFACAFIPPLRGFPEGVIDAVSRGYQAITGESPYATAHKGHDVTGMIRAELEFSKGRRINLARIRTRNDWDRVCIFGPYTTNAAALPVLGTGDWDIERLNRISVSDSISTLMFMNGKAASYAIDFPRAEADFAKLTLRCFPRAAAVFERVHNADGAPEFAPADAGEVQ